MHRLIGAMLAMHTLLSPAIVRGFSHCSYFERLTSFRIFYKSFTSLDLAEITSRMFYMLMVDTPQFVLNQDMDSEFRRDVIAQIVPAISNKVLDEVDRLSDGESVQVLKIFLERPLAILPNRDFIHEDELDAFSRLVRFEMMNRISQMASTPEIDEVVAYYSGFPGCEKGALSYFSRVKTDGSLQKTIARVIEKLIDDGLSADDSEFRYRDLSLEFLKKFGF